MLPYLTKKLRDPLYKNSIFLMLSSLTGAGTGFIFWIIAARLYPPRDVGLASAIISAMNLLALFSMFGFDVTLVRFIPETKHKNELINTCLTISTLSALLLVSIFFVSLRLWAPIFTAISKNITMLILFILFTAISPVINLQRLGIFVGFRKTEYSFISSIITFTRLLILPLLISLGAFGIFISYGITTILAFIFNIYISLKLKLKFLPIIKKDIARKIFNYSFGNYIARIFEGLPKFVLPIMVINILGAKANAYFYIAWTISILLLAIPNNISISLLAEGSHNQNKIETLTKKALKFIFLLQIPVIILVYFFGNYILLIFGSEYSKKSLEVLRLLAIGSLPFSFNAVYASVNRIKKNIRSIIYVYISISALTLIGSYITIWNSGIRGIGISWILSNTIVAGCIGLKVFNNNQAKGDIT